VCSSDLRPRGTVILLENDDKPGVIGSVCTVLGNAKINIGEISWGRKAKGETAMTAINVDDPITPEILQNLTGLAFVRTAKLIYL
jgi:D-3-phosphoglycerate dehydrogenase